MEFAGVITSYVENISTVLTSFLEHGVASNETKSIIEGAEKSANQIEESVEVLEDDKKGQDLLQGLASSLPRIRSLLDDWTDIRRITEAATLLNKEAGHLLQALGLEAHLPEENEELSEPEDLLQPPQITFSDTSIEFIKQGRPGLYEVHRPKREPSFEIVLVHGLKTNAWSTWSSSRTSNVFWPQQLLPQDIVDAVIWVYCYNGDLDLSSQSSISIKEILEYVADELRYEVESRTRKPIVWLAHSLGGLLVKCCLTRSQQRSLPNNGQSIFCRTSGVLFLGTPHGGSSPSARAGRFANILSLFAKDLANSRIAKERGERFLDTTITNITTDFAALMDEQQFRIVSLYETKPLSRDYGPRMIVEKFTSLQHPQESVADLEGNHISMTKFSAREERGYQTVVQALKELSVKSTTAPSQKGDDASPTASSAVSAWDPESVNVASLYTKLRGKIEVPAARWRSVKHKSHKDGTWFLQTQCYQDWVASTQDHALLISGPVGCGKSMIAESILENIRDRSLGDTDDERVCHLHFFFRADQVAQQSATSVLKAFIAQALDQNNSLIRHANPNRPEDWDNLTQALLLNELRRMLEDNCWTTVYMILDGLDECQKPQAQGLYRTLASIMKLSKVHTVCTTSPPGSVSNPYQSQESNDPTLLSLLKQVFKGSDPEDESYPSPCHTRFETVHLQEFEPWKSNVKDYLNGKLGLDNEPQISSLRFSSKLSLEELMLVRDTLMRSPHVSFSFVDSAIEYLQHNISALDSVTKIRPVLKELEDATKVHMSLVHLASEQSASCIWILCVLACAMEPLRVSELAVLWHFDINSEESKITNLDKDSRTLLHDMTVDGMKRLIYVDGDGVHLVGDSVRRVLLWAMSQESPLLTRLIPVTNQTGPIERTTFDDLQSLHTSIARSCLRLLLHINSGTSYEHEKSPRKRRKLPARRYASKYWSHHVAEAGDKALSLTRLISDFEASQPSRASSPTQKSNYALTQSKLLMRLVQKNLFVTVGSIFERNDLTPQFVDAEPIDIVLDSFETTQAPRPEVLRTLQSINSHTFETEGKRKRDLKLRIIQHIEAKTFVAVQNEFRRTDFSSDELITFLKAAVDNQYLHAASEVLDRLRENPPATKGTDLFQVAIGFGDQGFVQNMLRYSDLFDLDAGLATALEQADIRICKDLLAHGAKVTWPERQDSPLHKAARKGLKSAAILLLQWNADVDAIDSRGRTALHLAAENDDVDLIEVLLKNSASLLAKDDFGRTPFFSACACGKLKAIATLRAAGAVLWDKDMFGRTILHAIAEKGFEDLVGMLLSAGLDPNAQDNWGATPLHKAAEGGWASVMGVLLDAGADPLLRAHMDEFEASNEAFQMIRESPTDVNAPQKTSGLQRDQTVSEERSVTSPIVQETKTENQLARAITFEDEKSLSTESETKDPSRTKLYENTNVVRQAGTISRIRPHYSTSIVHFACRSSNAPESILELLSQQALQEEFWAVDGRGRTPSLVAAQFSTVRALKFLSEMPEVNGKNLLATQDKDGHDINYYVDQLHDPRGKYSPQKLAERQAHQEDKKNFLASPEVIQILPPMDTSKIEPKTTPFGLKLITG